MTCTFLFLKQQDLGHGYQFISNEGDKKIAHQPSHPSPLPRDAPRWVATLSRVGCRDGRVPAGSTARHANAGEVNCTTAVICEATAATLCVCV